MNNGTHIVSLTYSILNQIAYIFYSTIYTPSRSH